MIPNNNSERNSPAEVVAILDEYIEMLLLKSPEIRALREKYRRKAGMPP